MIEYKSSSKLVVGGENVNGITLESKNNNGIFQTEIVKGKEKDTLAWESCYLYNHDLGITISKDIRPKFKDWNYLDYADQLRKDRSVLFLEPMSAYEDLDYLTNNPLEATQIAELKMDGHRALVHIGEEANRVFSRRISKKTDWYNENTDCVPHIRDLVLDEYAGTVIDGEMDYGTTSMGVQSVMGALPANAIQYQFKNGFIKFFAFDILYYKGINVQKMPLWKRKVYLMEVINAFQEQYGDCNMEFTKIYVHSQASKTLSLWWKAYASPSIYELLETYVYLVKDYKTKFEEVISDELEGMMVKDIHTTYEQKKTKNMIKLKGQSTWDCVMMGLTEPTKEYEGKHLETWNFWENPQGELVRDDEVTEGFMLVKAGYKPVSKPYFMGWCGGIQFGVFREVSFDFILGEYGEQGFDIMMDNSEIEFTREINGEPHYKLLYHVGDCKGLTESILQDLKENAYKYIREEIVLEVLANGIIDKSKGSLRHPRWKQWRLDKSAETCTFKDHIRELE